MHVIDLEGNEYPLQATSTKDLELNGNQSISMRILPTKVNKAFIEDITEMWEVIDHDEVEHKIVYVQKRGEGDSLSVEIKAIPLFFDKFNSDRLYEEYNGSMTINHCLTLLFSNTDYHFILSGSFNSIDWQGFGGGDTKLELFKRVLNRYNAEFRIVGKTIHVEDKIGRDTQFMYHYRLNASNIILEHDANAYYTYAKGYGNYSDEEDWKDAKLIREYMSPLAQIIGIRHAPPIKDGRITIASTMDNRLKELVDESLKISVSATIHDLRKQGYELAQPELGDRVFLIDERIGFNKEVRVVNISIRKDWKGNVLDIHLTFGDVGITRRYQSNIRTAVMSINNLLSGNIKLPYSAYDDAITHAVQMIKNAETELQFPERGGIWGVDPTNPNFVTGMTSKGFMVSTDGGETAEVAITAEGVVAEKIIGKAIKGVSLTSEDEEGIFHVNGSNAEFLDNITGNRIELSPSGFFGYDEEDKILFQADPDLVTSSAFGTSIANVYLVARDGYEGRMVRYNEVPGDGSVHSYVYMPFRALGIHANYLEYNHAVPNGDNHIYAKPNSTGSLKVTRRGTTDVYRPVEASQFNNASSITQKTNIEDLSVEALPIINNLEIKQYLYQADVDEGIYHNWQVGVISELSPEISSIDGKSVNINKWLGYLTKAQQELYEEILKLLKRVEDLELLQEVG